MKYLKYIMIACTVFIITACQSAYQQQVKKELTSGVEYDTLFLNLTLGQTMKDFHSACWDLNKEGKIGQGPGNKYAKYVLNVDTLSDNNPYKVEILFYGMFDRNKVMYGMDMKMEFSAWSPWNKELHAPGLLDYMDDYYMKKWEGNPFMDLDIKGTQARVKVDGNRQIVMYILDNKEIAVKITDLRKERYQF